MKKISYTKIKRSLFLVMGLLILVLLVYVWSVPNIETRQKRELANYKVIQNVTYHEIKASDTPVGIVREFRFVLSEKFSYDTTLAFRFTHQNAEVYLENEKVYDLKNAESLSLIRTTGNNWAMIPLYREDIGKEVRVLLTPVYNNYRDQSIQFMIGSKLAIYTAELVHSMPELILSMLTILAGLVLLGLGIYFSARKEPGINLYTLALLAVSLGIWNFSQTDFSSFMMQDKTVFLYYLSLTMLMLCVQPLIQVVRTPRRKLSRKILQSWSVICEIISIVQLVLQLLGIYDLKEMLKLTHIMIAVSSLVLIISVWIDLTGFSEKEKKEKRYNAAWLLGVGALLDLFFYYTGGNKTDLLFVLIAILCYVLIEGVQVFFIYIKQKTMLEKIEKQLTLSRLSTMLSQIRSHFVFNILNAISGMCKYDPEKADETVIRFARYLRSNIDIMEDDRPVLFSAELNHLEDYVLLEQIRFDDKIQFYTEVNTDQFKIPPLILQPIVENAIKHGLRKKPTGGTVILRTWEEAEAIKITVEDDGVGFELSELEKKESIGLKNIRYRLYHLIHATLTIESNVGKGTIVTISIPKNGGV